MPVKVLNRSEAAKKAELDQKGPVGKCQLWTREIYGAPAVGDVDGDRDADAVDGWKSEDPDRRHNRDYSAPRGVPLAWKGGSKGFGHRAISLGNGRVRSIDVDGPGSVGTRNIFWFERNWGMQYLGWSETISGILIPLAPKPVAPTKKSVQQIAREVIAGKWGNGAERKARLLKAGYNYAEVQKWVNKLT